MFWVYGIVILVSIALGFFLWPKANRSFHIVALSGLVIGGISMLGIYITQWWPVEHQVVEKVVKKYVEPPKIVYKDRIVYKAPGPEVAPVDIKEACKGKYPLVIKEVTVSHEKDTENQMTWLDVTLVGSKVVFTCGQPGNYSSWKTGDIVQITRGEAQ